MRAMNVAPPDPIEASVHSQVAQGRDSGTSEHVREPIRADERRKAQEALEIALLEGIGGPEAPLPSEDWTAIGAESAARQEARPCQP